MNPKKQKAKDRRRARILAEQAWEAVNEGNLDLAEKIIRRAVSTQEDNPVLWNDQGVILGRRHKDAEAGKSFTAALSLAPTFADGFISLGQEYMEKHDFASAVTALTHALEVDPNSGPAHQLLGYALLTQGYAAQAIPHLQRVDDKTGMGIAQIQTGQLPEAVANLQAALVQRPNDQDLLYYLGRASGLLSKQSIDTLLAAYPDSARAHQALAENYFVLRQMYYHRNSAFHWVAAPMRRVGRAGDFCEYGSGVAPVTAYETGSNRWLSLNSWPGASQSSRLYRSRDCLNRSSRVASHLCRQTKLCIPDDCGSVQAAPRKRPSDFSPFERTGK